MALCSMFCCVKSSNRKNQRIKESTWRIFSLRELQVATNNFNYDNKLGEGGFGSVYWGQLWDASQIAVKRLKSGSGKAETEFYVEVEILGRVRHKNLLSLRGYSSQGQERIVVSDYMTNLSLLSHLHGQHSAEFLLDWNRRMDLAIGAAEGIAYLHHFATPRIIHGNIKASNVLLDEDFKAKVSEFGFIKLVPEGAISAKGARGYLAPEYASSGKASAASDVYSFGVLLLELATGKRPLVKSSSTCALTIIDWAVPLARERKFSELVDPDLDGKYLEEEWRRVLFVGLICAHSQIEKRPTMLEVVELLKGDKEKVAALENDEMFKSIPGTEEASKYVVSEKVAKQESVNV
ncbi:hypothetical protein F511_22750 [Dorcoceras hygrometricum]|uniref:Protein kinase domain-containing protein n=1 Tax=Dorcoceras hygrometricum TaxID=472368 RepID=A0A2Z7DC24_9LAMI|nr:hypothetical protein F511_22750 [Dorcoceras hygrometricum]